MRIFIIGGTGNISTPITRTLIERGEKVVLYKRGNERVQGAEVISGDRTKHTAFEKQMQEAGEFDCVIDMVGYDPEDARSLVRAFKGRTRQLVFCSTVDVYTKPAARYPIVEEDERKPDPAFEYAYKKAQCEFILEEAHARGDFAVTILRPAATYNEWWAPIGLLTSGEAVLKRIRDGKPIIVPGDGTSIWASSHRDDVARAFVNAAGNPVAFGKAYNVTADELLTWEEYYNTAARVMMAPPIRFVHIPADLLARMAPKSASWCDLNFKYSNIFDNSRAKADLGFRYTIPWEEGVRRMLRICEERGTLDNCPDDSYYETIIQRFTAMSDSLAKELSALEP